MIMKNFTFNANISKCRSLLVAALAGVGMMASAQSMQVISSLTDSDGTVYDGVMSQAISPNHRYIAGTVTNINDGKSGIFVYDLESDKCVIQPDVNYTGLNLSAVTDDGVAVGYNGDDADNWLIAATTLSIDGETTKLQAPEESSSYAYDITDDGKTIVGYYASNMDFVSHACVWKDGKIEDLPVPASEEAGMTVSGSEAKYVSADGSVICGALLDEYWSPVLALWSLQDDGSYKCEAVGNKYYSLDGADPERPYMQFYAADLSRNGKYVALKLGTANAQHVGRYNVGTGEFEECMHEANSDFAGAVAIDAMSVADDGTILASCVTNMGWSYKPCLWKAGDEMPQLISAMCPELEQLAAFDESGANYGTSITPDGRYVTGYSDDSSKGGSGMYMNTAYVIDLYYTTTAIDKASNAGGGDAEVARYTVGGTRVSAPVKGLNIVKKADGSTVKVMVK